MSNKGKWLDVAEANLWDTNNDGKPNLFKDGTPYHSGMVTMNIAGALVRVFIQASPGQRKGSLRVRFSMPVEGHTSPSTAAPTQPTTAKTNPK